MLLGTLWTSRSYNLTLFDSVAFACIRINTNRLFLHFHKHVRKIFLKFSELKKLFVNYLDYSPVKARKTTLENLYLHLLANFKTTDKTFSVGISSWRQLSGDFLFSFFFFFFWGGGGYFQMAFFLGGFFPDTSETNVSLWLRIKFNLVFCFD